MMATTKHSIQKGVLIEAQYRRSRADRGRAPRTAQGNNKDHGIKKIEVAFGQRRLM